MATTTAPGSDATVPPTTARPASPVRRAYGDTMTVARRNLLRLVRTPQLLFFSTVQPVMFVLLFRYVFGGAIRTPGLRYVDYLIPGVMVQTTLFGGGGTAIGLSEDVTKGMMDRFRSLPMARMAVLSGRTLADAVRNVFVVLLMVVVGTLVGFRFHNGFAPAVAAVGLTVLFGFAFSWFFALMGLFVKDSETALVATLVPVFPLVFASSSFTPVQTMPGWLQAFAKAQPVSVTVNAIRALTQGGPTTRPVVESLLWILAVLLVFVPLAIRKYRSGS